MWLEAVSFIVLLIFAGTITGVTASTNQSTGRRPVIIEGKKVLPLRIITRPFSHIYAEPDDQPDILQENVPTFSIFFVYSTPKEIPGWYEVGTDNRGNVKGWMKEEDVIEWKQAMTMSFTPSAGRRQTLFFDHKEILEELAEDEMRAEEVQSIRNTIDRYLKDPQENSLPETFSVAAMEPAQFVDKNKRPYLMPVISFEDIEDFDREANILEIASAVKGTRKDPKNIGSLWEERQAPDDYSFSAIPVSNTINRWKADVVFVIDATASMQPYIDGTKVVVKETAKAIAESAIEGEISFGLVAYRDSIKEIPEIEYTSKIFCNFEEGTDLDTFLKNVEPVVAADVGSVQFDEDVWAGIKTAISDPKMKPRDGASLFVILIGDAAAHDFPHSFATTKMTASELRQQADLRTNAEGAARSATIAGLHLITEEAKRDNNHVKASRQFMQLVNKDPYSGRALYFPVKDGDPDSFKEQAGILVNQFVEALRKSKHEKALASGAQAEITASTAQPAPAQVRKSASGSEGIEQAMQGAILAAQLEWLGSKHTEEGTVNPPRDIRAWVVDADLENTNHKRHGSPTAHHQEQSRRFEENHGLHPQGCDQYRSKRAPASFRSFKALWLLRREIRTWPDGTSPSAGRDCCRSLSKDFRIRAKLLDLTDQMWVEMGPTERDAIMNEVESKLALYESFYNDSSMWVRLHESDEPGDYVMFIPMLKPCLERNEA